MQNFIFTLKVKYLKIYLYIWTEKNVFFAMSNNIIGTSEYQFMNFRNCVTLHGFSFTLCVSSYCARVNTVYLFVFLCDWFWI